MTGPAHLRFLFRSNGTRFFILSGFKYPGRFFVSGRLGRMGGVLRVFPPGCSINSPCPKKRANGARDQPPTEYGAGLEPFRFTGARAGLQS
jgi:hypothetical protein